MLLQLIYSPRKTDISRESQRRLCFQSRPHLGSHMRVLHSRGTGHPISDLSVRASLLDSLKLLLFSQPITSAIILFTSSPNLLVQTQLQSIQWPWNPPFLLVGCWWLPVITQWLEHSTCSKKMSHKNIITIYFSHLHIIQPCHSNI